MIPSVSGERRGTELVAESGLNGLELWQMAFRGWCGTGEIQCAKQTLLNTTLHVSIEP